MYNNQAAEAPLSMEATRLICGTNGFASVRMRDLRWALLVSSMTRWERTAFSFFCLFKGKCTVDRQLDIFTGRLAPSVNEGSNIKGGVPGFVQFFSPVLKLVILTLYRARSRSCRMAAGSRSPWRCRQSISIFLVGFLALDGFEVWDERVRHDRSTSRL